jgi:hypothetical protein
MKNLIAPCLALTLAAAFSYAGPAEDAAAAAKKLASAPNYSWTRNTEIPNSQFPSVPIEGQTEKGGFTITTVSFNGNAFQTVTKGEQSVSQGQDGGWVTAEERRAQFAARGGGGGTGGTEKGGRGRGGFGFGFGGSTQVNPADDAASLASKIKDAKVVDGAIVGTLSAEDAGALLSFGGRGGRGGQGGGQTPPAPKNASGTVKYWVKDGALTKYSVTAKGTVAIPGGDEREVERVTTTEFKNIGSTKISVPEEAKKKLGL